MVLFKHILATPPVVKTIQFTIQIKFQGIFYLSI